MTTPTAADPALYQRHRYPTEIISPAVWLYYRFTLRYRAVAELLAARGIPVTDAIIRQWCLKFGPLYAHQLRRRRPQTGDQWPMDEVFLKINGATPYLGRAVDHYGNVLAILVTSRRAAQAAKRFFRTLLKGGQYVPRVIITDKLASYGAAKREIMPGVEHRPHQRLNNRAENSQQPTRQKERQLRRFWVGGPGPTALVSL